MVQTLALKAIQDGILWPRRPLVSSKGLLSCIKNIPVSSSYPKRPSRFRAVTFNVTGDLLAATDERGRIFVFYVTINRYSFVKNLGTATIYCCFNPTRKTELLVTCEDTTVRCIDVQSQMLISTLRGHQFPARCASFHHSGPLALTASQDAVILWETEDWSRYRVLKAGPGVQEAMFVAQEDLVAVCFQDDTILMWDLESLELKYSFLLPEKEQSPGLQQITVSDDHQVLVASGQAPFIYVWSFELQTIRRIMELPSPIKQVVKHAFLPGHNAVISVLADNGDVLFLDVVAKNPQIKLEIYHEVHTISSFDIECHARYLAASTSDGYLLLYDIDIARETAARAQERRINEKLVKIEDHAACIRSRSGVQNDDSSVDVDPVADLNKANAFEHNRPVSSKLIDNLFGVNYPRQANRTGKQTQSGVTRSNIESSRMLPSSATRAASVRAVTGSFSLLPTKVMAYGNSPPLQKKTCSRRTSALSRPPAQLTSQEMEVNRKRLVSFLKCNGTYPTKYRVLTWRFLLRLPKNEEAFRSLVAKGKHPVFVRLQDQYTLQNTRTFRRLHRILSAIVYWCPAFGEMSYLPAIVYPFVEIFRENDLAAFEASLSIMLHWCGEFLVSLPYPPVFALSAIENEVARRDVQLYDHFAHYQVAYETYAWSLLKTLFTEVLSDDDWMCLWDHLFTFSDTPQLLFVAVLAYLSYFRTALLATCDRLSIEQFFHQQHAINIQKLIQLMMNLRDQLNLSDLTVMEGPPSAAYSTTPGHGRFWPLSRKRYPTFAHYPQFVVDFQLSECNKIALEAAQAAYKHKLHSHMEDELIKFRPDHEDWRKERKPDIQVPYYKARHKRRQCASNMESSAHELLEETAEMLSSKYRRQQRMVLAQQERGKCEMSTCKQKDKLQRMVFETRDEVHEMCKQREIKDGLPRLIIECKTRAKRQELRDMPKFENCMTEEDEQTCKATMQSRCHEECVLPSEERHGHVLSDQQLAQVKLHELEIARHACHNEQQECIDLDYKAKGHKDAYLTLKDRSGTSNAQAHEEDTNSRHCSQGVNHRKAATVRKAHTNCRDHQSLDDDSSSDREESCRRWNVAANDGEQGNDCEESECLPRTADRASNKFAVDTSEQDLLSMSFESVLTQKRVAETSIHEKPLSNCSSRISSHRSSNRTSSHLSSDIHARGEVAADETSSAHRIQPRPSSTIQEEMQNRNEYAGRVAAHLSGKELSLQTAPGFPQVENEAQGIRHTTFSQEHVAAKFAPQGIRQVTQTEEAEEGEGGPSSLGFSVENKDTICMPRASLDRLQVHNDVLSSSLSPHDVPPAQEEEEHKLTPQDDTHMTNDKLFPCQSTTGEDSYAMEGASIPCVTVKSIDFSATEQRDSVCAPVNDLTENLTSDSKRHADSSVISPLQRPIAELEKKLGICFDDSSDEEEESVNVLSFNVLDTSDDDKSKEEEGLTTLLERAKRLLEVSSFNTDSDDDL